MTTTQSFRIYEVLQRHFKNSDDAKIVVQEIEQIIETKIENKANILATKGDIALLKEDLLKFQIDVEKRFYNSHQIELIDENCNKCWFRRMFMSEFGINKISCGVESEWTDHFSESSESSWNPNHCI